MTLEVQDRYYLLGQKHKCQAGNFFHNFQAWFDDSQMSYFLHLLSEGVHEKNFCCATHLLFYNT